jgi:hypothetical protein
MSSVSSSARNKNARPQFVEQLESRTYFDLVPTIPGAVPSSLIATQKTRDTVVVDLTNSGASPIRGAYTLELLASPNGLIGDATAITTVTKELTPLAAGKTRAVTVALGQFPLVTNGGYNIIAEVTGSLAGVGDNTAVSGGQVTVTDPFIDLSDSITLVGPLTAKPSHKSVVAVVVTNNGNVAAKGPVVIDLGDSVNADGSSPTLVVSPTVKLNLAPGKHETFHFTNTIAITPASNTYFAVADVDPGDTFSESNTSNNTAVSPTELTFIDTFPDIRSTKTGTFDITKGRGVGTTGTATFIFSSEVFTDGKLTGTASNSLGQSTSFVGTITSAGVVKIHGGIFSMTGILASGTITATFKDGPASGTLTVS